MVEGWQEISIGELGKVVTGITPATSRADYYGGDIPFVSPSDLDKTVFLSEAERTLTASGLAQAKPIPEGAVLFSCIGIIGKTAIAGRLLSTNQQINAVVCDSSKADNIFLYYLLNARAEHIKKISGVQTVPIVNKSTFESTMVLLPRSLGEQRNIAKILQTWDEAIEALNALIKRIKKRQSALVPSLAFGQRQLKKFYSSNSMQQCRWFECPENWSIRTIDQIADEISERNADGRIEDVLSCTKYGGFVRSLDYFKKQVFSSDLTGYKKIWRDDFGFPSNHVEEGSIGLQNLFDIGVVSPIYTIFRFNSEIINNDYAFAVLKTSLYQHIFAVSTNASVDRRGSLRWGEFSKIPFPVPPIYEQQEIALVLKTQGAELNALYKKRNILTRQKRGLMQKLLTGEWRVAT